MIAVATSAAPLRQTGIWPTRLHHPKALVCTGDGRVLVGGAGTDGGVECWLADAADGHAYVWQRRLGRVRGIAAMPEGSLMASLRIGHTSTITHLSPEGDTIGSWGEPGTTPGRLGNPQQIALTSEGTLAIVEATGWDGAQAQDTNRVQIFTVGGTPLDCWGTTGEELGCLNLPVGLAAAPDGTLWVADTYNHRIQHVDPQGRLLAPPWGRLGAQPGEFNCPQGVCLLAEDLLLIADTHNHRIQCCTTTGQPLWEWDGGADGLWLPCAVACDARERILVADTMHHRIRVCEPGP